MTYGYARVSTLGQDVERYRISIQEYAERHDLTPVVEIVEEKVSGTVDWRERKLGVLVDRVGPGDSIVAPALSRLARSMAQLVQIVDAVRIKGAQVHLMKEGITAPGSTAIEKAQYGMMMVFAEFEREVLSERVRDALAAKKAQGVKLGRPPGPRASKLDPYRSEIVRKLRQGVSQRRIAEDLGTSPEYLCKYIRRHGLKPSE